MSETTPSATDMYDEFLFDFDHADLKRFVQRLPKVIPGGFGKKEAAALLKTADTLTLNRKSSLEFPIQYDGAETRLMVLLHSEEKGFVTLFLYSVPGMIADIESELALFIEDAGD